MEIIDDDQLMERLRTLAALLDSPPPSIDRLAREALLTSRGLDLELARLVLDSAVDAGVVLRGDTEHLRLLSFETETVSVELQVHEDNGRFRLRGLVAGVVGEVTVETVGAESVVAINPDGWFVVEDLPAGLVRLRMTTAEGAAVATSWWSM